jgi:hypothetical protein
MLSCARGIDRTYLGSRFPSIILVWGRIYKAPNLASIQDDFVTVDFWLIVDHELHGEH